MKTSISIDKYNEIAFYCKDQELDAIWIILKREGFDFSSCRDNFLWIIRRLLEENLIKLVNMRSHTPLMGTVDEQINIMRTAFPKDDEAMDNGFWFLLEDCPAGSAWQHPPDPPLLRRSSCAPGSP